MRSPAILLIHFCVLLQWPWNGGLISTTVICLIMQTESEVRLLCLFHIFLPSCPCPRLSVVSVSASLRVEWIICDPGLVYHALRGVSESFFGGPGLQRSSFPSPLWFLPLPKKKKKVFTQPCLQRASGWSRTVTNRLLWRLSWHNLSPRSRLLHSSGSL